MPEQKILNHLKLETGALLLLVGGKHAGMIATMVNGLILQDILEEINDKKIIIKTSKNQKFETLKKHAFVIGREKPALDSIKQLMTQKKQEKINC